VTEQGDRLAEWTGRELFDANGHKIGRVVGLAFSRRRYGATWLRVETILGKNVLVPAERIDTSRDRLVLPYPKSYVEGGPVNEQDEPLSRDEGRRLCLHYGFDSAMPNSACRQGCGLCMAKRRAERSR
jgi:hypothetical protein